MQVIMVTERKVSQLFNGEHDNISYDAVLPVEREKERSGILKPGSHLYQISISVQDLNTRS
jgi:hypothetical protein